MTRASVNPHYPGRRREAGTRAHVVESQRPLARRIDADAARRVTHLSGCTVVSIMP
jgi:hypothetical protein